VEARNKVKEAVDRSGLRQRVIAERAGVSESTVSRLVSGEIELPAVDVAIRLADALGVDVRELFSSEAA